MFPRFEFFHPDRGSVIMRSRLEITWARYLTQHKLPWEYEPVKFGEGYRGNYTPDFGLFNRVLFLEIKPSNGWTANNWLRCTQPLIIVFGHPAKITNILVSVPKIAFGTKRVHGAFLEVVGRLHDATLTEQKELF